MTSDLEETKQKGTIQLWGVPITRLLGLLITPIVIAGVFMWGLWDPPSRLDNLTAAVVNLDEPVEVDGQLTPLGRVLAAELIGTEDGSNFDWRLTDEQNAAEGLENGDYITVVTIPKNFSAAATSLSKGPAEATQATINIETSERAKLLDPALAAAVTSTATRLLNEQLGEAFVGNIFVGMTQLGEGVDQIYDGATELASGADQLADGVSGLSEGAGLLADGASQLAAGGETLAGGVSEVATGAGELSTGMSEFALGVGEYQDGADQLAEGVDGLSTGLDTFAKGTDELATGADGISTGTSELATGAGEFSEGVSEYATGVGEFSEGLSSLATNASGLADGATQTAAGAEELSAGASELSTGLGGYVGAINGVLTPLSELASEIAPGLEALQNEINSAVENGILTQEQANEILANITEFQGTIEAAPGMINELIDGGNDLAAGASELAVGADSLATGTTSIAEGITGISGGLDAMSEGAEGLVAGADLLADGASGLATGSAELAEGTETFATGVSELNEGAGELAEGSTALSEGAAGLASGAGDLSEGAMGLSEGTSSLSGGLSQLADGATEYAGGSSTFASGFPAFTDGVDELATGTSSLAGGAGELATGIGTMADEMPRYTDEESAKFAELAIAPVAGDSDAEATLFNGSGAPLFVALALWAGALASFLLLRPLWPRTRDASLSEAMITLKSVTPGVLLGVVQGALVGIGVGIALKLSATELLSFIFFTTVVAVVFALVNQALVALLGGYGKFISVIILSIGFVAGIISTAPAALSALASMTPFGTAEYGFVTVLETNSSSIGAAMLVALWGALAFLLTGWAVHRMRTKTKEID